MANDDDFESLIAAIEAQHPGFRQEVAEARQLLHRQHPDPNERRQYVLSHFVHVEDILACDDSAHEV